MTGQQDNRETKFLNRTSQIRAEVETLQPQDTSSSENEYRLVFDAVLGRAIHRSVEQTIAENLASRLLAAPLSSISGMTAIGQFVAVGTGIAPARTDRTGD